jgi:hypothetical protein
MASLKCNTIDQAMSLQELAVFFKRRSSTAVLAIVRSDEKHRDGAIEAESRRFSSLHKKATAKGAAKARTARLKKSGQIAWR